MFSYISAINPMSCKDFFSRVSSATFLAIADDMCFSPITIDPQGPGMGDPPVPGIRCCKRDNTGIRTEVSLINICIFIVQFSQVLCYSV